MAKNVTNEGLFGSAKKFTDAFFDGLKNNAIKSMLAKAKKEGDPLPIIQKLKNLEREKEELDDIIKKYSK